MIFLQRYVIVILLKKGENQKMKLLIILTIAMIIGIIGFRSTKMAKESRNEITVKRAEKTSFVVIGSLLILGFMI